MSPSGTFLSGPGKRFLGRVLAKRGSSRYNAEQALADHWLQNEDLVTVIAAETVSEARKVSVQFSVDAGAFFVIAVQMPRACPAA